MAEGLIGGLVVFVLAMFVGVELITKVPPTLHTPLMSGANAISGIALIGALILSGSSEWSLAVLLGFIAEVDVKYAIHPVAGRMPGHMNVLLTEADVPYSQLYDMEAINPEFEKTDVVLVVGANDIVNPAARHDPASPIFGMPILDVDKARAVIIIKRSLNPGFAGIDNELCYHDKTLMLFGHAREVLTTLVNEVKQLP